MLVLEALKYTEHVDLIKTALSVSIANFTANPSMDSAKSVQDLYKSYLDLVDPKIKGTKASGLKAGSIEDTFKSAKTFGVFGEPVSVKIGDPIQATNDLKTMDLGEVSKWLKSQKSI